MNRQLFEYKKEFKQKDRNELDSIILKLLNLDPEKYLKLVYDDLINLIEERKKFPKMINSHKKVKITKDIKELKTKIINEIIIPKKKIFPKEFLNSSSVNYYEIQTNGQQIKLGDDFFGRCEIFAGDTKIYDGTINEGKYIQYSYIPNNYIIKIPKEMIVINQAVQNFEIYLKKIEKEIAQYIIERTGDSGIVNLLSKELLKEIFNKY